jgi:VCBS repeat-containing protein
MFVASRVESGDQCKAAAAALPQVIGNIQTALGCGTLTRANGVAVQVVVGDPVYQGDVIETAAHGLIGIRFIDGTAFNLSHSARAVLNEFVCDSNGTLHSALFGVTTGTFAFIAGRVAQSGSLRIDTPVGSIRGRAYAGGFGMLSLAALTFSMMKEVQAADPNATFLDDDSIEYKDLAHGKFELVTKEAIPRHIIVEDPGETIVLNKIGSSVSVNEVANSPTRMAELQEAQQDVLANYAKGLGPSGSSTPSFFEPLPVQPINFTETSDDAAQTLLAPPPSMGVLVPEIIIVHPAPPPPPLPEPPTLTLAKGPTENDTRVFDDFTVTSGTFAASSPNSGAVLTYGISGGAATHTVLGGVAYDVSGSSPYGTLFVNSTTGAYAFVPNNDAINALQAPTTDPFIITVSDGTLSASQTFTITINGANDAASIAGTAAGSVIEAGGVANAAPHTPTVTGTLTDTDVDNTPNTFTAVSSPTASAGGYGTFTITKAGVWTYTVDNANHAVQALNVGDTLTDTFRVTTIDGTPEVVTVTIHGANDAAIISGGTGGSVIEAGGVANAAPGTPTATGTLTDTDVDNTPNTFTAVSSPTASVGGYGTFTITAAGAWTYTVDNTNHAVQALNVGDTLTDTFKVTTIDGTPEVVTVTIHGANDAAIISGTTTGSVFEARCDRHDTPTATGTLTDTDVDNIPNTFTAVSSPTVSAGGYGTFTMTAAGVWTYTLDEANHAVQALNVCDTLTDTFKVTTIDGTPEVVTVTIHGANDAAIISGATAGSVIEAGGVANATHGTPTATGTLTDTDVDNTPNTFTAVSSPTASDAGYGTFKMTAAGAWTYTLDNANHAVQALNVGNTLTDTFKVTTVDGTPQVVTVTIHGANDAAIISGTTTGSVIEAGCDRHGTPTATGTLTDTDVDNTPNTFTAVSSPTASDAGYGTFKMTAAGVWTYTLDNANHAVQALNACDTLTDTFKVTTIDGTAQVVTVTIHGTNDAPRNDFWSSHGDSFHFKDEIFGHQGSDALGPAVVDFAPASTSHPEDAAGIAPTTEQPLPGQHSTDHFSIVPDHAASVVITHAPHDLIV